MGIGGTRTRRGGQLVLATGIWLAVLPAAASAQFFGSAQGSDSSFTLRPPKDVPSVPPAPAQTLIPPSGNVAPPAAKGPLLQPPATNLGAQAHAAPSAPVAPTVPPGQGALAVSARFGRDLPAITGGLHWRVYRTDQNSPPRLVKEEKGPSPTFILPPGAYVVSAGFGLANITKAVQMRAETMKDVFEIPAGGLRIEGRVGDARIPQGQISFDLYKGSQFEPGDKRPIATSVMTGDIVLLPEGAYHIVSNYGDANATVRSDIRVEVSKLTDATINHRAAIITLKLVNERGGEARANTQWSVLTPGGDVIKESIGAFPRVILAEGDYRAIARNDSKTYEGDFRVVNGVDREVEIIAR
jgi:hypothetical protein